MTEDDALKIVADYQEFIKWALDTARAWGAYVYDEETASAYISDDDMLVIETLAAEMDLDCPALGKAQHVIPTAFAFAGSKARAKMLVERNAATELKRKEALHAANMAREAQERATFEALKRKFGSN